MSTDYQADYREAQRQGHHPDCDGHMLTHRVHIHREMTSSAVTPVLYSAVCDECGPLHIGSFSHELTAKQAGADHSVESPCDYRCQSWT